MPLNFPNASRSLDPTHGRVRFWGYDRSMEIVFFVEPAALIDLTSGGGLADAALLDAFDHNIGRIHKAARAAYARQRQGAYVLTADDLAP